MKTVHYTVYAMKKYGPYILMDSKGAISCVTEC